MIRVGIIGAGIMGADHAHRLSSIIGGATLGGTFDIDPARAASVAALSPGARAYDDPHALIEDRDIDAVLIASSDATHTDFVLACLAAGKPVLCEKPLAPTVAECELIVHAEVALGRRLISVGFMRRHDPGYLALRTALTDGSVGAALMVHNVHRNASAGAGTPSAHLITGSAVHEIDLMRWLLSEEIVGVTVHRPRAARASGTTADPLFLVLETSGGVVVDVEVFVNAGYGYDVRCELVGELGTATLDVPGPVQVRRAGSSARTIAADWRPRFAESYRRELQEWIDAITHGRPLTTASAWDGLVATTVAAASVDALDSGLRQSVTLAERPPLYVPSRPGLRGQTRSATTRVAR